MSSQSHRSSSTRGFTVLELIASIAVMVIIMTMLAMGLGGVMPASKAKQANVDIVRIQHALERYKRAFGEYPKEFTVTGLSTMEEILFNALAGRLAPKGIFGNFKSLIDRNSLEFANENFPIVGEIAGPIINTIVDPWGNPYRYRYDPDGLVITNWENFNYVLFSKGPDGAYADVTLEGQKNEGAASNQDNIYAQ